MSFQPFALDEYFEDMIKGGISQGKAREDWFQDRTDEASMDLAAQADAMKKKMKNAGGIFGTSKLGKIVNTLIPIIVTATAGPAAGAAAATALATANTATRQRKLKKRQEDLEKMATQKGKYAGTFLQDYMEQGLSGLKSQTTEGLKGLKQVDLISGLLDIGLSAIPGFKGGDAAKEVGKEVGKEAGKEAAEKSLKQSLDKGLKAVFGDKTAYMDAKPQSDKFLNKLFASIEKGINTPLKMPKTLPSNMVGPDAISPLTGPDMLTPNIGATIQNTNLDKNILKGLTEKLGPLGQMIKDSSYYKMADFATNPLLGSGTSLDNPFGQRLLSTVTTPSMYSPIVRAEAMDYLNPEADPTVVRAQNPYQRYRV